MKIYAIIGESGQVIDARDIPQMPPGYIEMKSQRPWGDDYVAAENGEWIEYKGSEES